MRNSFAATFATSIVFACGSAAWAQPAPKDSPTKTSPTSASREKVYDEAADARKDIAAALSRAERENKRVLIQWGGNWCSWCLKLNELCKRDKNIAHELLYEYEVVHVDAGKNNKNLDLAQQYQAPVEKEGFPYLTVLDASGKVIANHETGSLELKDSNGESVLGAGAGHDPAKVLKFLQDHQAPALNASEVLAAGLSKAKASDKRVFLHFGAPWCGWCRKLEAWMRRDDVGPMLAKEFVDVKIDTERMTGGDSVFAKYNANSKTSGIPWFVFLDSDGKVLAASERTNNGKAENIGFPSAPDEIATFREMLSRTHMSKDDAAKVVASLQAASPATH